MSQAALGVFIALALTTQVTPCFASTVRGKDIEYQYGSAVKAVPAEAFVVCDGCRADTLYKQPLPFVTIRRVSSGVAEQQYVEQELVEEISGAMAGEGHKQEEAAADVSLGLLNTVLFRFDSDRLSVGEKRKLDQLVSSLLPGTKLVVTGYTCALGVKSYNKHLSQKRAQAVAEYLKYRKAIVGRVEAKGECCPVSKTNKKLNRRVEIEKENH